MPAARAAKRRMSLSPTRYVLVAAALVLALSHTGAAFVFGGRQAAGVAPRDDFALGQGVGSAWTNGRSSQQTGSPRGVLWPAIGCVLVLAAARSRISRAKGGKGASISMKATSIEPYSAACYSLAPSAKLSPSSCTQASCQPETCNVSQMDLLRELDEALAVRPSQPHTSEVPSVMVGASLSAAAAPQHRPGAARYIGGARRASRRSARSARRATSSEANERRHIGARLQAHPVVYDMPPPSYDVSRVRTKVQVSLLTNSCASQSMDKTSRFENLPSMAANVSDSMHLTGTSFNIPESHLNAYLSNTCVAARP